MSLTDLEREGVYTKNVCYGKPWTGFITKPTTYINYMKEHRDDNSYAILMDSDTMFSGISTVAQIWNKYDCILKKYLPENRHREIVMSTETSCWVGQYCTPENITKYYNASVMAKTPSYSPFANSGMIMGSMNALTTMLNYVVEHSENYFLFKPHQNHRYLFDDQFAYADYCHSVEPSVCKLDYHQSLAASISMTWDDAPPSASGINPNSWPFVCRVLGSDQVSYNCPDVTFKVARAGYMTLDPVTCGIVREWKPHNSENLYPNFVFKEQLQTLDPRPAIYHGNGAGKNVILNKKKGLGFQSFECMLKKHMNITGNEYLMYERFVQLPHREVSPY